MPSDRSIITGEFFSKLAKIVRGTKQFPAGSKGERLAAHIATNIVTDVYTFQALQRLTAEERAMSMPVGRLYQAGERPVLAGGYYDQPRSTDRHSTASRIALGAYTVPASILIHRSNNDMAMNESSAAPDQRANAVNADLDVPAKLPPGYRNWKDFAEAMARTAVIARKERDAIGAIYHDFQIDAERNRTSMLKHFQTESTQLRRQIGNLQRVIHDLTSEPKA